MRYPFVPGMLRKLPDQESAMSVPVACRDILVYLLANSDWETIDVSDLVEKMDTVSRHVNAQGITCLFVAHRTNSNTYWSDDASYEFGLLGSMGLLRLRSSTVEKTGADYHQYAQMFCARLPDDAQSLLLQLAR
jgi:hypothetical protein